MKRTNKRVFKTFFLFSTAALLSSCSSEQQQDEAVIETNQTQIQQSCMLNVNDILLTDGKIITVDGSNTDVSQLRIIGDRIVAVGEAAAPGNPCTQTINLQGRTVIPGLIDNHNHWAGRASRPGHHVAQLDSAYSIEEVLTDLQNMAETLPLFDSDTSGEEITADDFVTSIGAFDPIQFVEGRMPTLEELDSIDHPVFLSMQFDGPSRTNSAGKRYFEARGITIGPDTVSIPGEVPSQRPSIRTDTTPGEESGTVVLADGQIAQGPDTLAARNVIAQEHNFTALMRGTVYTMQWSASLGLTMSMDESGGDFAPFRQLERDGRAITRLRVTLRPNDEPQSGMPDRVEPPESVVPEIVAYVENTVPDFGNNMYRVVKMGESIAPLGHFYGYDPLPSNYDEAVRVVAKNGWSYDQHNIGIEQGRAMLGVWEQVNEEFPITEFRWSLGHIFAFDTEEFDRMYALGAGAALHSLKYTTHTFAPGNIPYRTAFNHPIHAAGGTDGGNITTINPWNALYFMTTGLNSAGEQVLGTGDEGETVTRRQALQMYTKDAAWFTFDEHQLGSLEIGKLADMVILSHDYDTVPDEALRLMHSVVTIVDGNIVYSNGDLLNCEGAGEDGVWYPKASGARCNIE